MTDRSATEAPMPDQGPKPIAVGERAMASTSHPSVTAAVLATLRAGGNAVDAMLTAMPLQAVIEPQMTTIAGAMTMLYYEAATGEFHYLNGSLDHPVNVKPPRANKVEETSGARVAIPGFIVAMRAAADRFGVRPWSSYFEPAIEAAEAGFAMYSFLYGEMASAFQRLGHYPAGREQYLPNGFLPPVGEVWRQPKLAATLRRVAEPDGVEWFQRGEFAERFVAAVNESGGQLNRDDMANYTARWQTPLHFRYRHHALVGAPPPETGGLYLGLAFNILQNLDLAGNGSWLTNARAMARLARVLQMVDNQITQFVQDPFAYDIPVDTLLSPEYGAMLARLIEQSWPRVDLTPPKPAAVTGQARVDDPNRSDSNHLVIVDEAGNWVTMLHSVYGSTFGTGLVVDGVSVNSGNGFRGVSVGPGRRTIAPICPAFIVQDGAPWLGLGTPSYPPPFVAQALVNHLDYGMPLEEAIAAPRFRLEHELGVFAAATPTLATETRLPTTTLDGLVALGWDIRPLGDFNWHVGSMQAVRRDPASGHLLGYADPRRGGWAAGY